MGNVLLLSMLLLGSVSSASTDSAANGAALNPGAPTATHPRVDDQQPFTTFDNMQLRNNPALDRVCLNIHAFIFKLDDDRVPKLVGETTCMSLNGGMKRVDVFKEPRVVPVQ